MILEATDICVELGSRRILDHVSVASRSGKLIGLIGPNGAGKTTLLRVMAGLQKTSHGALRLDGEEMSQLSAKSRARRLAYLPQDHVIHWPLSVNDLVMMGRLPFLRPFASPDARDRRAVGHALEVMSVLHLAKRSSAELSGGERARVLLARALAQTPGILLADEPTAGLDPAHKLRLLHHLSQISDQGVGVILVLHDLSMAARFCDHLVMLDRGCVFAAGRPHQVLTKKNLSRVYHIKAEISEVSGVPVILPLDTIETNA